MRILLILIAIFGFLKAGEKIYAIYEVKALNDSKLSLDSVGIVKEINAHVGDYVAKNQVLLVLKNEDKRAQLNGIKQQLDFAKRQYERFKTARGAIDANTLESYLANYKKLEADYEFALSTFNKTLLKAPFAGIIAAQNVQLGESANGALFRLISKEKKLLLQFDAKYLKDIIIGDSFTTNNITAKINKIYPIINEQDQKGYAEVLIDEKDAPNFIVGDLGDGMIDASSIKESSQDTKDDAPNKPRVPKRFR
ncbi:MAG: efflux transporter periplasmic adaptor subunit [Helicobacter sp.]|nr:efflux transporter periplasmic adaptor subunit [Helicobacter sp.]